MRAKKTLKIPTAKGISRLMVHRVFGAERMGVVYGTYSTEYSTVPSGSKARERCGSVCSALAQQRWQRRPQQCLTPAFL